MSYGVGRRCGSDPVLLWLWHPSAGNCSCNSSPSLGTSTCCRYSLKKKKKKKKKETVFKLEVKLEKEPLSLRGSPGSELPNSLALFFTQAYFFSGVSISPTATSRWQAHCSSPSVPSSLTLSTTGSHMPRTFCFS